MGTKRTTLADKLDVIVKNGGEWSDMVAKANTAAKRMKCTTKYSIGVLKAHINYRIKVQNKVTFLGEKVISETGIN